LTGNCGRLEYSPWQSNVSSIRINEKSLNLIDQQSQSYPFRVAVLGDPQGHPEAFRKLIDQVNENSIDFIVVTGDLTDYGLKDEFEWVADAAKTSDSPILFVPGNHDGLAYGPNIYQKLFGPLNYTFKYADTTFVMWNNNKLEFPEEPNWPFLKNNLDSNSILVSHIPPTEDIYVGEELVYWKQLMKESNIPISLHGHLHRQGFFKDEYGTMHYIASASPHMSYGMLTVHRNYVEIETCYQDGCFKNE
jgi:Icc-related predicted phosphoesterase